MLTSCTSQKPLTQEESSPASAQFAQIILLETEPKFAEGNKLLYGKLQITLPDGVTIEEQKAENDMRVIDLIGAEKAKMHRSRHVFGFRITKRYTRIMGACKRTA